VHQLVEQTRAGSARAASRLISMLENEPHRLPELFSGMGEWPQVRLVVGLTGPPGVGKSTLSEGLIASWRQRRPEARIGVLAVDPSSPFTGGAVLGDRVRMMKHATDRQVFIRSLANRGHLGGLTLGIKGSLRVMGLLGCDVVLIETVGVGQSEVEVVSVADLVAVILAPGQGDGVQMLKAGLMEAGDIFVINKADRDGADRLYAELRATLSMFNPHRHGLTPAIARVCAVDHVGIDELVETIEKRYEAIRDQIASWRRNALQRDVIHAVMEAVYDKVRSQIHSNGQMDKRLRRVLDGSATVEQVADELLERAAHDTPRKEMT